MFVFEIITPGTWLDYPDRDWSWKIEMQLKGLQSLFFEANSALNLFTQAQSAPPAQPDNGRWDRDAQRRTEIQRTIEQERGSSGSVDQWDEIHLEAEIRFKREKWSEGRIPHELESHVPFIYARAFLYALDAFDKFLGVLAKEANVPAQIAVLHAKLATAFPDLRGVRNTSQHLEDRSRGLGAGRNPQPLVPKPVTNGAVDAPGGGVVVLNILNGSKYGSTMADGHYGEVDVAPESMGTLQGILHEVLHAFNWRGSSQHSPSA